MRRIAAHVDENPFFLRENGEGFYVTFKVARMIRIKWINLLKDADGGRIGFLSMCTIIILPKIPNQASHHMVTLHRNMTCRSLKRLGAAKGLEDGHMTCHEYMLMCYTRPHR